MSAPDREPDRRARTRVLWHAPGPAGHGVVRHARSVARLAAAHRIEAVSTGPAALTHVHFTDQLFGPDIDTAAAAFRAWAATAPRPLVVTLHDLPGADPDPARDRRRRRGYAMVVAAADAVVVGSRHEARRAAALGARAPRVIALPVEPLPVPASVPDWAGGPSLGVLGFVYPGKGHAEAIAAAARQPCRPLVVAAGAAADGHQPLVSELRGLARRLGVRLLVTGSLSEQELADVAAAVTVALAPARAVSASGSLATWLGARRRPVAAAGAYTRELAARHPGAVTLYDDDAQLDAAVARGVAHPGTTRLDAPPSGADAGAEHAALYRDLTAC